MKNQQLSPYCTFPYCIVICALFSISESCSPVPQVDDKIPGLRRALETAEQSSAEGRIVFSLDQPPVPLAAMRNAQGDAPTCHGPAQPLTLVRARLGQTAVFTCRLDHCPNYNATSPDLDQVLWVHNDCPVHKKLCKGHRSALIYSQTRISSTAYLFIHNVTFDAVGSVYCDCHLTNTPGGLCVNQGYHLAPILNPADVFEAPVLNVTRPAGTNVTLISKLRIRMAKHTVHRYIVRYNRRIIWAPASHPLHTLTESVFPYGAHFALHDDNLTMTIPYMPQSFSGQYEVWVRPYMEEDEFVVQTINLKLI